MKRRPPHVLCSCAECAELDLEFPGEGRQLAFPLRVKPKPRARRRASVSEGSAQPCPN